MTGSKKSSQMDAHAAHNAVTAAAPAFSSRPEDLRGYYAAKFGADPAVRFAEPLGRLKDRGFIQIEPDAISINRDGLLQIDKLLHEFFLPEHQGTRYV